MQTTFWFGGDVRLIRKALEKYVADAEFSELPYKAGKELENLEMEIQSARQILDQIQQIKDRKVKTDKIKLDPAVPELL